MNDQPQHPRFVTIEYFVKEMLGFGSRSTYYNHRHDKGFPQRVYPTGKPMLVYDECVAYLEKLMENRVRPPVFVPPSESKPSKPKKKKHTGRPARHMLPRL